MTIRIYDNWINGKWVIAEKRIERYSPAHGDLLAEYANSGVGELNIAVASARTAFDSRSMWQALPASERAKLISKWADLIERDLEKLAAIEAEEVGKPLRFARAEIQWSIELARYAAALAWQIPGNLVTTIGDTNLGLVSREPRGVIGMIVPWNFPLVCLFQKLPYALAAGCTTVIKPSDMTSGTALEVAALSAEAGIPDGVVNVVTGAGRTVGEGMTGHADLDMVSFTGSTTVGIRIAQRAAEQVKRIGLELGGKGANIVFADADIDAALDGVLFGYILNQGEECCQGARLLIEESIANDFVDALIQRSKALRIGLPLDSSADMCALISEPHMQKVLEYVAIGLAEGAQLALGGKRITRDGLDKGFYIEPTILTNVTSDMRVFREEIFGPVLTVTMFRTAEQAIALANDTNYGLASGLWTKDIDKAVQISRELKSGMVYVNTYLETAAQLPFGGFKHSGVGRENGLDGLLEFTETKSTFVKLGKRPHSLPHTVGTDLQQL